MENPWHRPRALLVLLLVATCLPPQLTGHGVLVKPRGRNLVRFYTRGSNFWNPQGLNSGGPAKVSANQSRKWPNGLASLCGGDVGTDQWMQPGPVQATYKAGQVIEVHQLLYNNHGGQFRVSVCPRGATQQKQCKALVNVERRTPYFIPPLPRCNCVNAVDGRTSGYPSKIDGFKVYNYPKGDQFGDYPVIVTRWRLPAGFKCKGCFLQWYWITATTCQPPCKFGKDKYCYNWKTCGAGTFYPEEFRNCADINVQ